MRKKPRHCPRSLPPLLLRAAQACSHHSSESVPTTDISAPEVLTTFAKNVAAALSPALLTEIQETRLNQSSVSHGSLSKESRHGGKPLPGTGLEERSRRGDRARTNRHAESRQERRQQYGTVPPDWRPGEKLADLPRKKQADHPAEAEDQLRRHRSPGFDFYGPAAIGHRPPAGLRFGYEPAYFGGEHHPVVPTEQTTGEGAENPARNDRYRQPHFHEAYLNGSSGDPAPGHGLGHPFPFPFPFGGYGYGLPGHRNYYNFDKQAGFYGSPAYHRPSPDAPGIEPADKEGNEGGNGFGAYSREGFHHRYSEYRPYVDRANAEPPPNSSSIPATYGPPPYHRGAGFHPFHGPFYFSAGYPFSLGHKGVLPYDARIHPPFASGFPHPDPRFRPAGYPEYPFPYPFFPLGHFHPGYGGDPRPNPHPAGSPPLDPANPNKSKEETDETPATPIENPEAELISESNLKGVARSSSSQKRKNEIYSLVGLLRSKDAYRPRTPLLLPGADR